VGLINNDFGEEIRMISSMSKIRNSTRIRKNWMEKWDRDDRVTSNPHSKGVIFWFL